jgi:hypothetical protein
MKYIVLLSFLALTSCAALLKDEKDIEKIVEDVIAEEVKPDQAQPTLAV